MKIKVQIKHYRLPISFLSYKYANDRNDLNK